MMKQSKAKIPKSFLIAPLALIVCCFGPYLFLLFSTGAAISFFNHNKLGFSIFGILLAVSIFLILKYRHFKNSC